MKNWNTNTTKFKSPTARRLWEISQLINYGLDGEKLSEKELKEYWPELKKELDPERARMLEYIVWGKAYSLPTNKSFWGLSPKTHI